MQPYYEKRKGRSPVKFSENNCVAPCVMVHPHWHEAGELLLIRRGSGEQLLNNERLSFQSGDIVWIRGGDVHATTALSADGCGIDYIKFEEEYLLTDAVALPPSTIFRGSGRRSEAFFSLGKRLMDTDRACQVQRAGALNLIVGMLLQENQPLLTEECSTTVQQIYAFMEAEQDLRLERVAARLGYSPEHISRLFHKETGMTYHTCCSRVKMLRAARLLRGRMSTSEVAEALCYSDESSFIRAFRRYYGLTPCRYRQQKGEPE